jgi:glucan-binding YG repeat protein
MVFQNYQNHVPSLVSTMDKKIWVIGLWAFVLGLQGCISSVNEMDSQDRAEWLIAIEIPVSTEGAKYPLANEYPLYKKGFINTRGEMVVPPRFYLFPYMSDYDYEGQNFATNGLAAVCENNNGGEFGTNKCGYINTKGEIAIPLRFQDVQRFTDNGLAAVEENGKWGYINAQGVMIVPTRFDRATHFAANGLAAVRDNVGWGYINSKGEMVIPAEFYKAESFGSNGLALVINKPDEAGYALINTKGEVVLDTSAKLSFQVPCFAANGLAPKAKKSEANVENWGYTNIKGEWVIQPRFQRVEHFADNGLAAVMENDKWGYINAQGEMVIPVRFQNAQTFTANNLAAVMEKGKWGYINAKGESVINPRFEEIKKINETGEAWVKENNKWGYLNANGNVIINPRFDASEPMFYSNGVMGVKENEKEIYIIYIGEKGQMLFYMMEDTGKQIYFNEKGQITFYMEDVNNRKFIRNSSNKVIWSEE